MEPVGYDGYGANGIYDWVKYPSLGDTLLKITQDASLLENMYKNLFSDNNFVNQYNYHLKNHASASYKDEINKKNNIEFNKLNQFLSHETDPDDF